MNQQDDLLTTPFDGDPAETNEKHELVPVVASSRSNVLEWLSSRVLTPRAAFEKYYEDTLAVHPSAVPVVVAPVNPDLLRVEGVDAGNFPVLVELDQDVTQWLGEESGVGVAGVSTLARAAVRIHFRNQNDLTEFEARQFDNIDLDQIPRAVTPELFSGSGGPTRADLEAVLSGHPASEPAIDYSRADALSGARLLALHAGTSSEEQLAFIADRVLSKPAKRPPRKKLAKSHDWLFVSSALAGVPVKNAGPEERLFLAAAAAFLDLPRQDAWDAQAVLGRIDETLRDDGQLAEAELSRWTRAKERIESLLRGDQPFVSFTEAGPAVEKALLLALIRDTPDTVLSWASERVGAHEDDLLIAAVLVGLRFGRKAVSTSLRPPALDDVLARIEVADLKGAEETFEVAVGKAGGSGAPRLMVTVDGQETLVVKAPPLSAPQLLEGLNQSTSGTIDGLIEIAVRRGWKDALDTRIKLSGAFEVRPVRGGVEISTAGSPEVSRSIRQESFRTLVAQNDDEQLRGELSALTERPSTAQA